MEQLHLTRREKCSSSTSLKVSGMDLAWCGIDLVENCMVESGDSCWSLESWNVCLNSVNCVQKWFDSEQNVK